MKVILDVKKTTPKKIKSIESIYGNIVSCVSIKDVTLEH